MGHRTPEQGTRYTERGAFTGYKVSNRSRRGASYELRGARQHRNKKEPTYEAIETLRDGKSKIVYRTLTSIKESLGIKRK